MKNLFLTISRIIVGTLFIFSGLIKLNDPEGTGIKLEEYFQVFSEDIAEFFINFVPMSMFFSVFLSSLEVVLGVALLINYRAKITTWILLLMIGFFTFLTFYSAYFEKVTDCGCFGDAIPLTPWQSFSKDVVLSVLILFIFIFRNSLQPIFAPKKGNIAIIGVSAISLLIAFTTIEHLSFIDFRPYAVGDCIPANMQLPPDAKPTIVKIDYTLKNKITGESKTMTDKEYMETKIWQDTNWTFVSASEPIMIQEGDKPKIPADFEFFGENGEVKTQEVFVGSVLVIVSPLLEKANMESFEDISKLVNESQIKTMFASASSLEEMQNINIKYKMNTSVNNLDPKVIKAMIRSNPGILLLNNGCVVGKWHYNDTPSAEEVQKLLK